MAKKRAQPESDIDKAGHGGVLERLSSTEATIVLNRLLQRHPGLRSEAESVAREVLGDVSFVEVADDVESELLQFDYDDLNDRAGSHSWGYVEPSEAAWEMLDEAVKPFVDDMKRYFDLGLEEQAQALCQGILLGLYRVRDGAESDVLNWAADFAVEAAGSVLEVWSTAGRAGKKAGRRLPSGFVTEYVPEWKWIRTDT